MNKRLLAGLLGLCSTVIVLAAIAVGCSSSGGGSNNNPPTPSVVAIPVSADASAPMGFSFQSPVTAKSGDTIHWVNNTVAPHGITWDAQSPSSSPAPGENVAIFTAGTSSGTFTAPTVTTTTMYNYHCTVHGPTMNGIIVVSP